MRSFFLVLWAKFRSGDADVKLSIVANAIAVITPIVVAFGGFGYLLKTRMNVDAVFGFFIFPPFVLAFLGMLFLFFSVMWHAVRKRNDVTPVQREVYSAVIWLIFFGLVALISYICFAVFAGVTFVR